MFSGTTAHMADFLAVRIAVLTVSSTRVKDNDASGQVLCELLVAAGHVLADRALVADGKGAITAALRRWLGHVDVVLATGGTGVTGSDVTPEVFEGLYEKAIPGFGELFRWQSYAKIGAATIQSRATAGVCQGTYLFALPGSPGACRDAWEGILKAQLDVRTKPCNLVSLLPRLRE
jgi:molybdenum cofactor biosynthesis protein B